MIDLTWQAGLRGKKTYVMAYNSKGNHEVIKMETYVEALEKALIQYVGLITG